MPVDLLVFAPHPDDAELSCGGWLALTRTRGQHAVVVDLTRGELGTNGSVVIREQEAAAASEVLGLSARENTGLPDGGLTAEDPEQVAALVAVIRKYRPGLAVAPWIEERHPDHAAAGRLAQKAWFFAGLVRYRPELGAPFRPSRLLHYLQRTEVLPDFVVDVSSVWERKRASVACHASQFPPATSAGTGQFEVRDRYWGASIGVAFGEPYRLGAPVPIADPVAHFAAHPAAPALIPPR
jgi:bacillithiol biosynthesis deacetylase BshB1